MPRRLSLLPLLLVLGLAPTGCGGSGGDTATAASVTTIADGAADAERLDADRAREAVGPVSVCGPITTTRALVPGLRRLDAGEERLQVSTLGFPDGVRASRHVGRGRTAGAEGCDLVVAHDDDEVRRLATAGGLFDLAPALATWVTDPGGGPLRPVRVRERAFGLSIRGGVVPGVLVVPVGGRNPGGALEVLRVLGGARARRAS